MRVVCIIQARMGSHRLGGKVLMDVAGKPILAHCVNRARRCPEVDVVVVATTDRVIDSPIADWCKKQDVHCFRGPENDVLRRFHTCAIAYRADIVVRLTGDCPMVDPDVISRMLDAFMKHREVRYLCNTWFFGGYPSGFDCEIFTRGALEEHHAAMSPYDSNREHVMSMFRPIHLFPAPEPVDEPPLHLSVDTREDLVEVEEIVSALPENYTYEQVMYRIRENPCRNVSEKLAEKICLVKQSREGFPHIQ